MRLSLRQLDYLVAIIDAGSMTHAAARLNVTPTSLSLQMKQLEELVGTRLLQRHSRGVSATECGAAVYQRAAEILRLAAELERLILDGGVSAPNCLRLGSVPAATRMLGVEAMAGAAHHLKGIKLELSEGWVSELMDRLDAGSLDFVIGYDLAAREDIVVVEFFADEFLFICRPGRHPDDSPIELAEVLTSDLVFYGQKSMGGQAVIEAAQAGGLPAPKKREVQSIDVWRGLLRRGMGASVAPFSAVREEVLRGELSVHRIVGAPIVRHIGMAAHRDTLEIGRRIGFVDFMWDLIGTAKPVFRVGEAHETGQIDWLTKKGVESSGPTSRP